MNKEFIPYEQALELKELGFDEPCFALYAPPSKTVFLQHYGLLTAKEQILAPLYQQAFRFFCEKYNKLSAIDHSINGWYFVIREIGGSADPILKAVSNGGFNTYEEAEDACLIKLIEIVKKIKENDDLISGELVGY